MIFTVSSVKYRYDEDLEKRVEIRNLDELKAFAEKHYNEFSHSIIIDFESMEIEIYDDWRE